jgi:ABC-2 type transport system ATP-binding protein
MMATHSEQTWLAAPAPASSQPPALVLTNLSKAYDKKRPPALWGLNLQVERGEIFGLLGPNGSGKTTTLNLLTGLLEPSAGSIEVLGLQAGSQRWLSLFTKRPNQRRIRARIGFVPQETALYTELTARENLEFHAALYGVPRRVRRRRIRLMLKLAGLYEVRDRRVKTFSGGMQRRLAIVRALLHDPDLLILDEPTLGVDVQSRQAIYSSIRLLQKTGKTILLTTNQIEEAEALADRVAILDHGQLLVVDTVKHLTECYGGGVLEVETEQVLQQAGRLWQLPGVTGVSQRGCFVRIQAVGMSEQLTAQVITRLSQESAVLSFRVHIPTLEEIFLQLTGTGLRD